MMASDGVSPGVTSVSLENLSLRMGSSVILDNVTATIPGGSTTAIVGPNGAGKTSLLLALLGQYQFRGRVRIECEGAIQPRIAYVPQGFAFDRGVSLTVIEFMTMGIQRRPFWLGHSPALRERSCEVLSLVGAFDLRDRKIGALSGGELQRVLLAFAIQREPDLLLLDEVSSGVDVGGESLFCEVLESIRSRRAFTQVMVSHDLVSVTHHATHVICLNKSVIAEGKPCEVLNRQTLKTLFGIHLGVPNLSSMPQDLQNLKTSSSNGGSNA